MQSYKVIFKNGHFYQVENNKRILPKNNCNYTLIGEEDAFEKEDVLLKKSPTTKTTKIERLGKKYDNNIIKILDSNTYLYYRVGLGASKNRNENKQYVFKCQILEDLYIYLPKHSDPEYPTNWRLVDCECQLIDCIIGGIIINDEIHASSLNQLFTHTVMFYFSLQRSGSCNPFKTYFVKPDAVSEESINLLNIYTKKYDFLENMRIRALKNFLIKQI